MGVAGDAYDPADARPQRQKERFPAVVGLGVDGVEPQQTSVAARPSADGGDGHSGLNAAGCPALNVCGVEPDVGDSSLPRGRVAAGRDRLVKRQAHP